MSIRRRPWADHLSRKEWGEIGAIEAEIKWLRRNAAPAHATEIDALVKKRERIVNRGSQRARLAAKRTEPARAYRKSEGKNFGA